MKKYMETNNVLLFCFILDIHGKNCETFGGKKPDRVQPFKDSAKVAMKKVLSHCHELFNMIYTFTFT